VCPVQRSRWKTLAFLMIFSVFAAVVANGQAKAPAADWTPDKKLAENLAPAQAVEGGYSIRPPKGYRIDRPDAPPGMKMFGWIGAARRDGSQPSLSVALITPPAGQAPNLPLEQLADKLLGGLKRRRNNYQQGNPEKGVVNGMNFARIRWTGTESVQNRKMEGFIYVAQDGNKIIQINCQDFVPEARQALPLAEASVLTFKKK
jgi:hypothetical protein